MGNCIKPTTKTEQEAEDYEYQERELESEFQKESSRDFDDEKRNSVKVKIMLTKEELEWLMFELKVSNGGKKLEDVLQEIERERMRGKIKAWKPSLGSIMESPEGLEV